MNKSGFTYYLLIAIYIGILGIVVLGSFLLMIIYFKDAQPIFSNLFTIFIVALICFVHGLLILFDFDSWQAKRNHQRVKHYIKTEKYIEANKGLISDLIDNEYEISKINPINQSTIKRLGIEEIINNQKEKFKDKNIS